MAWQQTEVREFLFPREERYKANDHAIAGMPRIEKIDFSGNIVLSKKPSKTDMIVIHPGDFVISGINVAKGAMAVYQGGEPVAATIHYSSYTVNKAIIELEYLKRFLKSSVFTQLLNEQVSGGIKTEIKPKHLLPLVIGLPTLHEQKAILERFYNTEDEYGQLVSEIKAQKGMLTKYRQKVLQEAIEGKLTFDWREVNSDVEPASKLLAHIAAEKAELIKEKKIQKSKPLLPIKTEEIPFSIPNTWQWRRLGDLSALITSGSRGWAKYYSNKGAKFIRMGNLSKDTFRMRLDDIQYVTPPATKEGTRTRLQEGDILVSVTGEVGTLGLVPKNFGEAYINQHTALIRLHANLSFVFFAYAFLSSLCQLQFKEPQRGVKNSFRLSDVEYIRIPLPPLAEQQEIVRRVEAKFAICDKLEAEIKTAEQNAQTLYAAILQVFFDHAENVE